MLHPINCHSPEVSAWNQFLRLRPECNIDRRFNTITVFWSALRSSELEGKTARLSLIKFISLFVILLLTYRLWRPLQLITASRRRGGFPNESSNDSNLCRQAADSPPKQFDRASTPHLH